VLSKEASRSRAEEDRIAGLLALEALGDVAGVADDGPGCVIFFFSFHFFFFHELQLLYVLFFFNQFFHLKSPTARAKVGELRELREALRPELGEKIDIGRRGPGWPAILREPDCHLVTLAADGTWSRSVPERFLVFSFFFFYRKKLIFLIWQLCFYLFAYIYNSPTFVNFLTHACPRRPTRLVWAPCRPQQFRALGCAAGLVQSDP
jgi:hypothetical protein